jgi:glutathione S-transferase
MTELLGMTLSPYTEKARFALDHHAVPYRFRQYVPMLGEPGLRLRLKKPLGKVSVPVLFEGRRAIPDSFRIARHADEHGAGETLFPEDHLADIAAFNDRSEAALGAGRVLAMRRMVASPDVREESLPAFVPRPLRAALLPVAGLGLEYVRRKYAGSDAIEGATRTFAAALVTLREALRGRAYLLGAFTFADIAMAAPLFGVRPVDEAFVHLGPATRAAFGDETLAREFADLLAWRDELYAKHRKKRARRGYRDAPVDAK